MVNRHSNSHQLSAQLPAHGVARRSEPKPASVPFEPLKGHIAIDVALLNLMGSATVQPLGKLAPGNWHRFGDTRADELLAAFERAPSDDEQRAIAIELQRRFAEAAPAIPLFANPLWGEFSTQ